MGMSQTAQRAKGRMCELGSRNEPRDVDDDTTASPASRGRNRVARPTQRARSPRLRPRRATAGAPTAHSGGSATAARRAAHAPRGAPHVHGVQVAVGACSKGVPIAPTDVDPRPVRGSWSYRRGAAAPSPEPGAFPEVAYGDARPALGPDAARPWPWARRRTRRCGRAVLARSAQFRKLDRRLRPPRLL